ncbi:MAG: hypothetical protein IKH45_08230 [Neisseriaceae bacterium]|nr:hypothetical protein [Neisseriaceae bacterium]MBR3424975.1 hypothetical protein [Neisseriaceae bacterium]MBR3482846.1 hypothetical protein [Neisseriaceae bacterium]
MIERVFEKIIFRLPENAVFSVFLVSDKSLSGSLKTNGFAPKNALG